MRNLIFLFTTINSSCNFIGIFLRLKIIISQIRDYITVYKDEHVGSH